MKAQTHAGARAIALTASILFAGVLPAVGAQAVTASAAAAQAPSGRSPVVDYVALGDSYAAGQGAGYYGNACLQSDLSYPEMIDAVKHVKLITDTSCSGASTFDVISEQLPAIRTNKSIDLVTVTVGANDLGGEHFLAVCTASFGSPECQAALSAALALLTPPAPGVPSEIAVRLASTLGAVAAAAPEATILVTGYPYLFETPPPTDPSYPVISQINGATAALNVTIAGVVEQLALSGVDIHYVDVTDEFAAHGIGSPDPWILAAGPDAFHPTAAGYVAYTQALTAEL